MFGRDRERLADGRRRIIVCPRRRRYRWRHSAAGPRASPPNLVSQRFYATAWTLSATAMLIEFSLLAIIAMHISRVKILCVVQQEFAY